MNWQESLRRESMPELPLSPRRTSENAGDPCARSDLTSGTALPTRHRLRGIAPEKLQFEPSASICRRGRARIYTTGLGKIVGLAAHRSHFQVRIDGRRISEGYIPMAGACGKPVDRHIANRLVGILRGFRNPQAKIAPLNHSPILCSKKCLTSNSNVL